MKTTIKNTLTETALLNRYLKSRGVNPEFVSKDQKVAHSKTNQFKSWMRDHANDPVTEGLTTEPSPTHKRLAVFKKAIHKNQEIRVAGADKKLHSEAVDKKDTITFDIPLLIRVLEFAREDLKSDVNLHKMVERLISMRGKGTLTMNQYGRIVKEEVESDRLDEISGELQHRYFKAAYAQKNDKTVPKDVRKKRDKGMNKVINRTLRRNTISTPGAAQDFKDQEARRGIGHVRDHVEVDGTIVSEAGNKPLEPHIGMGDSSTPRDLKTQMSGASTDFVKSTAGKKPGMFHSKVAHMQNKLAKSELRKRNEEVVAEGYYVHREKDTKLHFNTVAQLRQSKTPSHLKVTDHKHNHLGTVADVLRNQTLYKTETKETNYGGDYQASVLAVKAKAEKKPVDMKSLAARMQASYRRDNEKNKQGSSVKEETLDEARKAATAAVRAGLAKRGRKEPNETDKSEKKSEQDAAWERLQQHMQKQSKNESLEPMAACNQPGDGANSPDDVIPAKRSSKLKLLLGGKKGQVKEEMYDHEKEDKSTASPRKKAKFEQPGMDPTTKQSPPAAAILSGGKTLTGEPRDTIEIDPMMKMKKQSPDSQKSV